MTDENLQNCTEPPVLNVLGYYKLNKDVIKFHRDISSLSFKYNDAFACETDYQR